MRTTSYPAKIVYPAGADASLLRRLRRKAFENRVKMLEAEHAEFVRNAKLQEQGLQPLLKVLKVDRASIAKAVAAVRKSNRTRFSREKAPLFKPLSAHNPTRYAPFDMPWTHVSGGGLTGLRQYGPDLNTGETGFSIGIWNGGSLSTVSSVGFWYYPNSDATLHVNLNASVWGRAYVYSALLGYASAYAGLRLYIERYSSDFHVHKATSDIYDNWGVLELDARKFDWVSRSVSISLPARRNTWYAIWADAVQRASAGGIADAVSNFCMYMGPVNYWLD